MISGMPGDDAPEENKNTYRSYTSIYVALEHKFSEQFLRNAVDALVNVFEILFKKLAGSEDLNIAKIKKKYPGVFDKYFDTYHSLKDLSETKNLAIDEENKSCEYEVKGKKLHLTYEDMKEYYNKMRSFYKLAKERLE